MSNIINITDLLEQGKLDKTLKQLGVQPFIIIGIGSTGEYEAMISNDAPEELITHALVRVLLHQHFVDEE